MINLTSNYLIALYVTVGFYILYKIFFKKNNFQTEYETHYNEILTSKKYQVKGQHDRD